jgi:hypothetical protein
VTLDAPYPMLRPRSAGPMVVCGAARSRWWGSAARHPASRATCGAGCWPLAGSASVLLLNTTNCNPNRVKARYGPSWCRYRLRFRSWACVAPFALCTNGRCGHAAESESISVVQDADGPRQERWRASGLPLCWLMMREDSVRPPLDLSRIKFARWPKGADPSMRAPNGAASCCQRCGLRCRNTANYDANLYSCMTSPCR